MQAIVGSNPTGSTAFVEEGNMTMPEGIWGNAVNLSGLWSIEPLKLVYDDELFKYVSEDGDFIQETVGHSASYGHLAFTSEDREEVVLWTEGVKSAMALVRQWANLGVG